MKHTRRTAGYTWTDYKTNAQIAKELKITPILDKGWYTWGKVRFTVSQYPLSQKTRSYLLDVQNMLRTTTTERSWIESRQSLGIFLFSRALGWSVRSTCVYLGWGGEVRSHPPALLNLSSRYPNIIRVYNHSTHQFHAWFSTSPALSTQSASGVRQQSGRTCCIALCNQIAPVRPSCLLTAIPSRLAHGKLCTAQGSTENRKNPVRVANQLLTVYVLFRNENLSNIKEQRAETTI